MKIVCVYCGIADAEPTGIEKYGKTSTKVIITCGTCQKEDWPIVQTLKLWALLGVDTTACGPQIIGEALKAFGATMADIMPTKDEIN